MESMIIAAIFTAVVGLLIYGIRKTARKSETNLTIHEHPSSFTKPPIEYVSKNDSENEEPSIGSGEKS